jgi:hypothetical protein
MDGMMVDRHFEHYLTLERFNETFLFEEPLEDLMEGIFMLGFL